MKNSKKLSVLLSSAKHFSSGMSERKLTVFATSGCYYLFMSLVPIVMIFCCILPYTPLNQALVLRYIDQYFADAVADIIRKIVNAIYASSGATLTVSILLTLYSASASMKSLMAGMDAAYHFRNRQNFIIITLRALIYMVLLVTTLIVSLVIMVYGGRILSLVSKYVQSVGILGPLLSKARYLLVMVLLGMIFSLLYTVMPSGRVRFRQQLPGAVFAAVLWVLFSSVFSIYISISDKYGAYGFIGTLMVAMMWMYYCLFFLLIGGYINSYLTDRRQGEAHSEALSEDTDAVQTNSIADAVADKLPVSLAIGGCMAMAFVSVFSALHEPKRARKTTRRKE